MKHRLYGPLAIGLACCALTGCGSDSDSTPSVPEQEEQTAAPDYDNMTLKVATNEKFVDDTYVTVYLHNWGQCVRDPAFCTPDGRNTATYNDDSYIFKVYASELKQHLGQSLTPEFSEDQYSLLDLMIYLGDKRDDFQFTLGKFSEELGTYNFTVSFDLNGDGEFTVEGDGAENYQSPNWYANFLFDPADFLRDGGDPNFETPYMRSDLFMLKSKLALRIQPFSKEMTARRESRWKKEVDRYNQNGEKITVNFIRWDHDEDGVYQIIAQDVDVKPYNLRPDLFKKDTITMIDVLMSANDSGQLPSKLTFWPTLSTGTRAGSYVITQLHDQRSAGHAGWNYKWGEVEAKDDFFFDPFLTPEIVEADKGETYCKWMKDNWTETSAEACVSDWVRMFGGNDNHIFSDTVALRYPPETIDFHWNSYMDSLWHFEAYKAGDGKGNVYNIDEAEAPLDESHFGWKIADCGQCHAIDNIHLTGDSPSIPPSVEPYYCAQCHGSNGAPQGHGETARCYWCHSQDKIMTNHGDASLKQTLDSVDCGPDLGHQQGPCADIAGGGIPFIYPHDTAGNYDVTYPGSQVTTTNSTWNMSETFPDPYSCVTCHPNQ